MQRTTRSLTTALPTLRARPTASTASVLPSSLFASPPRSYYSTAPAPSSASAPGPDAAAAVAAAARLAYFVPRTAHGELPVYSDYKNGGSRVLTIVRKASGDVEALRTDLAEFLASVPSVSKPAQGQVILRGDWVREVKEWLAARGF